MENQRYMQEGLDVKRILLLFQKKIWMAAAAAAAGALLFGGVYLLIHVFFAPEREFESVSKLYLNFNCDPQDFNELTYNGYTWNDLMATDPILDVTMEALPEGTDRDMVIAATKAEILSDIRLLTITVTTNEAERTAQIMEATQKSLVHLGETDRLFDSIEVYSTVEPRQIVWDNRTANAAATGAVAGFFVSLLFLAFYYVMDDSVYVARDVEKRYGIPVIGILTAGRDGQEQEPYGREFAANYAYLCRDAGTVAVAALDTVTDAEAAARVMEDAADKGSVPEGKREMRGAERMPEAVQDADGRVKPGRQNDSAGGNRLPQLRVAGSVEEGEEVYRKIRETDGVVLTVRFGGGNGKRLERALGNLGKQDCKILGIVLLNADEKFLRQYYFGKKGAVYGITDVSVNR